MCLVSHRVHGEHRVFFCHPERNYKKLCVVRELYVKPSQHINVHQITKVHNEYFKNRRCRKNV